MNADFEGPNAPVTELAPAKLNLYLHITGRRDDGYHLLDSLIAFAEVGDVVTVEPADTLSLDVRGPFAQEIEALEADNLVMRAVAALANAAGMPPRAAIRLEKNLPVAAGIGGGSADAAAAIRALSRLWHVQIDDEALHRLALDLGADVPACLTSRPVVATGIGDILTPIGADWPAMPLVLVNPGIPLATPAVFGARSGPFRAASPFSTTARDYRGFVTALSLRHNDLEPAARSLEPMISTVLDAIAAQSGCLLARMSGSGATCFGLFETVESARGAARSIGDQSPDWWTVATTTRAG